MKPVPWTRVQDWRCFACGECCKWFLVPLRADELARMLHTFGEWAIEFKVGKAYIRRTSSRCIFQYKMRNKWLCLLQEMDMKPVACKLWPFIPLSKPKYGRDEEAIFEHSGERFYIYLDPRCPGITYGKPSVHFFQKVLPEVVELRLGTRTHQDFTTSHLKRPIREQLFPMLTLSITDYQIAEFARSIEFQDYLINQLSAHRKASMSREISSYIYDRRI